jgi:hypothetical protein
LRQSAIGGANCAFLAVPRSSRPRRWYMSISHYPGEEWVLSSQVLH